MSTVLFLKNGQPVATRSVPTYQALRMYCRMMDGIILLPKLCILVLTLGLKNNCTDFIWLIYIMM